MFIRPIRRDFLDTIFKFLILREIIAVLVPKNTLPACNFLSIFGKRQKSSLSSVKSIFNIYERKFDKMLTRSIKRNHIYQIFEFLILRRIIAFFSPKNAMTKMGPLEYI